MKWVAVAVMIAAGNNAVAALRIVHDADRDAGIPLTPPPSLVTPPEPVSASDGRIQTPLFPGWDIIAPPTTQSETAAAAAAVPTGIPGIASRAAHGSMTAAPARAALPSRVVEELSFAASASRERLAAVYDGADMLKPAFHWWEIDGDGRQYDTRTLANKLSLLDRNEPRKTTYHYMRLDPTPAWQKPRQILRTTTLGTGAITAAGTAFFMFLGLCHGAFRGEIGSHEAAFSLLFLLGLSSFIGLIAVSLGVMEKALFPKVKRLPGTVTNKDGRLRFTRNDNGTAIDLLHYVRALHPQVPAIDAAPRWRGALIGLGLGLVLAATGGMAAPAAGIWLGSTLSVHRRQWPGFFGALAGMASFALFCYGAIPLLGDSSDLLQYWLTTAYFSTALGAVAGAFLINPVRRAMAWRREFHGENQWWKK